MQKKRLAEKTIKWLGRTVLLGSALVSQTTLAEQVAFGGAYSRFDDLLIVATSSNNLQNCTNLIDALGVAANVSVVGTVRLPPATYNCFASQVKVQSNVTLEGSGQLNTKIIGQSPALFFVRPFAEVSNLAIENTATGLGSSPGVTAVRASGNSVMNNVTVLAEGTDNAFNTGVYVDDILSTGEATLNNVKIRASNGTLSANGVFVVGPPVILNGVNIESSNSPGANGIFADGDSGTITVRHSVVSGDSLAVNSSSNAPVNIADSQLIGGVFASGTGTLKCFSVYDENFLGLDPSCETPSP